MIVGAFTHGGAVAATVPGRHATYMGWINGYERCLCPVSRHQKTWSLANVPPARALTSHQTWEYRGGLCRARELDDAGLNRRRGLPPRLAGASRGHRSGRPRGRLVQYPQCGGDTASAGVYELLRVRSLQNGPEDTERITVVCPTAETPQRPGGYRRRQAGQGSPAGSRDGVGSHEPASAAERDGEPTPDGAPLTAAAVREPSPAAAGTPPTTPDRSPRRTTGTAPRAPAP